MSASSPWAVDRGCPASCAADPEPRVPLGELARRYAALTYTLTRAAARGDRLADPRILRGEARAALGALGVRLEAGHPERLSAGGGGVGTLVVANHISWLDAVALLAVEPVSVLAKREVGQWPVIGTLARRAGTRFIDRGGSLRQLPHVVRELAGVLRGGTSVLVFPQATTWCSAGGGRFRRAVFQAAADAGAPVRPVTVAYRQGGAPSAAAAFLGDEEFTASLRRVAAARGLTVRIAAHAPLRGTDRRELAAAAHRSVAGAADTVYVNRLKLSPNVHPFDPSQLMDHVMSPFRAPL
ncbi:1-acyl-sn-glycerol-3-phosphate acyltransferase [Streptomyces sp. BG9H]|uniref:1-acyl-sn-glycerol-3-phosphate acyltransferase n=1 Tax=Streptomyces anatolicus TaxID=2675858 RepID=A0ABS6YW18_9ACTN|nr:lysophospholipid acyltransferase family protein [Streptomyces anatolicus]MBW5425643.1 1-acyl-sn-glycerol-3-phosphate acyltransferase [Streptomyces anatolicus]